MIWNNEKLNFLENLMNDKSTDKYQKFDIYIEK